MKYYTYNNAFMKYQGHFLIEPDVVSPPSLFLLSVIRNQEMNNIIGDVGSTDLVITDISNNVFTVPNLPIYSGFQTEVSTWVVENTSTNSSSVFASAIDDVNKKITVDSNIGYSVGNSIALINPFLNYEFSGNQTSIPSISNTGAPAWRNISSGGGPIFKDGSTYKWGHTKWR
jgi:hypothetical protein